MEQRVVSQLIAIDGKLDGVASDVSDLKSNSDLFRQQILGDVDGESPHGRVPKLESDIVIERSERLEAQKDLHVRVLSIETWRTQYKAYGVVVVAVSGLVSSVLTSIIAGLALMMLKSYLEGLKH